MDWNARTESSGQHGPSSCSCLIRCSQRSRIRRWTAVRSYSWAGQGQPQRPARRASGEPGQAGSWKRSASRSSSSHRPRRNDARSATRFMVQAVSNRSAWALVWASRQDIPDRATRRIAAYQSTLDFGGTGAPSLRRAPPGSHRTALGVVGTQRHCHSANLGVPRSGRQAVSVPTYKINLAGAEFVGCGSTPVGGEGVVGAATAGAAVC